MHMVTASMSYWLNLTHLVPSLRLFLLSARRAFFNALLSAVSNLCINIYLLEEAAFSMVSQPRRTSSKLKVLFDDVSPSQSLII